MRKVQFPLLFVNGTNAIQYPDDIQFFTNSGVVGDLVVSDYSGLMSLDDYVVPVKNYGKRITKLAFKDRFTIQELVAVELAMIDNPTGTTQERQNAATLRVLKDKQENATFIDLSLPETSQGVLFVMEIMKVALSYTVQQAATRYDQIINTPVVEKEVPVWTTP